MYERRLGDRTQLVAMDLDARGRKVIELPPGGEIPDLRHAVSSDGQLLAFYTGSVREPYDLALHVVRISDGEPLIDVDLLTAEYPGNLSAVAKALPTVRPDLYPNFADDIDWVSPVEQSLEAGILSSAWSPSGNSLAFIGQIDGPSSDVYLLDADTGSVRRLTRDMLNSELVEWSPDGKWLLYQNLLPGQMYQGASLHSVRPTDTAAANPTSLEPGFWWGWGSWLSSDTYLLSEANHTGPWHHLQSANVETGHIQQLWPDFYEAYAHDPENELIALSSAASSLHTSNPMPHLEDGLYLLSPDGNRRKISDDIFWELAFLGGARSRFLGIDQKRIVGIAPNGSVTVLSDWPMGYASASPDGRWFVLYGENGMELFDESDQVVRTLTAEGVLEVYWRPDSAGLYFSDGGHLYRISVPAGDLAVVDQCSDEDCWSSFRQAVWLP